MNTEEAEIILDKLIRNADVDDEDREILFDALKMLTDMAVEYAEHVDS